MVSMAGFSEIEREVTENNETQALEVAHVGKQVWYDDESIIFGEFIFKLTFYTYSQKLHYIIKNNVKLVL